jgi:phage baseplate assembly protein V
MNRADFDAVRRMVAPLYRKLALVAMRAVVSRSKDSSGMQALQVEALDEEVFDDAEHMQPGGITHRPLGGAEGVLVTMCGVRDDAVVVAVSNREYRPKNLAEGETALYNASETQSTITIRANGDVEIALASGAKLKIGDGSQSFIKGDSFVTAFNTWKTALDTVIGFCTGPTAPQLSTYTTASTTLSTALTAAKSTSIKGE